MQAILSAYAMINLEYYNVKVERAKKSNGITIKGEVSNKSGKHYNSVGMRVILFVKNISIASVVILINGLPNGATKVFEKNLEDLQYDAIAKDITRFEVYTESAY